MNDTRSATGPGISRRRVLQAAGVGAVAASTQFATGGLAAAAPRAAASDQSLMSSFIGVAQAFVPDTYQLGRELGAGWGRIGASWSSVQPDPDQPVNLDVPSQGQGSFPVRELVQRLTDNGYQVLMGLGTPPGWAKDLSHRTFVERGVQFDFQQNADGETVRTVTDPETGEVLDQTVGDFLAPPVDVTRYEEYVEAVVSQLSQEFGVQHYVMTNEPNPARGISSREWVDKFIKPASAIIRRYGGKTIWGALAPGTRIAEMNKLLNYRDAWRDIDILDVHYWPPQGFQWLWEDWVKTRKIGGIWQSEVGAGISRLQVPNYYPRFLHWALAHGWSEDDADQYKLFYYKLPWEQRGPDGYHAAGLTYTDAETGQLALTYHGTAMKTLHGMLDGPSLDTYEGVRFTGTDIGGQRRGGPVSLDLNEESIEGFQVGRSRIVLAAHLPSTDAVLYVDHRNRELINMSAGEFKQDRFIEILVPDLRAERINTAEAIDAEGLLVTPANVKGAGGDTIIRVNPAGVIQPGRSFELVRENPHTFYVRIELR